MVGGVTLGQNERNADRINAAIRQQGEAMKDLAPLDSPALTGAPTAPTPDLADNSDAIATTAYVQGHGYVTAATAPVTSVAGKTGAVALDVADVSGTAPLASPVLTGDPRAPTPSAGDNDTSIATTAFVQGEIAGKAPLASPAFTGAPTAPTQSSGDNSTKLATTAYADAAAPWKVVKKTADQSVASNITPADDTHLQISLAANTKYIIRGIYHITNGSGGIRLQCNGPGTPTYIQAGAPQAFTNTGAAGAGQVVAGYAIVMMAVTPSYTNAIVPLYIVIHNGATAGTFRMQIAQNTSNASATTFKAGSYLEYLAF